jgi:hypothetical protein
MIGCFPDPYPDELFYSVCARYQQRVRLPDIALNIDIFSYTSKKSIIDLPKRLSILVGRLPSSSPYDEHYFAKYNSFLPLYAPFLSHQKKQELFYDMAEPSSKHSFSGYRTWPRVSDYLRYCPRCALQDREAFGETYWHRSHNVPFLKLCPKHFVLLRNTELKTKKSASEQYYYIYGYHLAEEYVPHKLEIHDNLESYTSSFRKEIDIGIAQNVKWLFDSSSLQWSFEDLQTHYIRLAAQMIQFKPSEPNYSFEFINRSHLLKQYYGFEDAFMELRNSFIDYFSVDENLLADLNCSVDREEEFPEKAAYWIYRILRPGNKWYQHPLRHFLFMEFLGTGIGSLLSLKTSKEVEESIEAFLP